MSAHQTIDTDVRLHIYSSLLGTGRAPTVAGTARVFGAPVAEVSAAYERLALGKVIVLKPGTLDIRMAAPLSAVPTPFPVTVSGRRSYFGNCIWDALGVAAMLGEDVDIPAACGDCGDAMPVAVRDGGVVGEGVVHFALPVRQWWENVVFT
jgi:hypothetical protein